MKFIEERRVSLRELTVSDCDVRRGATPEWNKLRRSIKEEGIADPLLVREKNGKLILVDGHRRYRIAKELGLKEVPVLIVEGSEDELKILMAIRNSGFQCPYSPLDRARVAISYRNSGLEIEKIAKILKCSEGYVSDLINILALDKAVIKALEEGKITVGHARLLLRVESSRRKEILEQILQHKLSVRLTEALIKGNGKASLDLLSHTFPPSADLVRVNGSREIRIRFKTIADLRETVAAMAKMLNGILEIEEMEEISRN